MKPHNYQKENTLMHRNYLPKGLRGLSRRTKFALVGITILALFGAGISVLVARKSRATEEFAPPTGYRELTSAVTQVCFGAVLAKELFTELGSEDELYYKPRLEGMPGTCNIYRKGESRFYMTIVRYSGPERLEQAIAPPKIPSQRKDYYAPAEELIREESRSWIINPNESGGHWMTSLVRYEDDSALRVDLWVPETTPERLQTLSDLSLSMVARLRAKHNLRAPEGRMDLRPR
ncbi:MAG: hypothetical protein ACRC0L_08840 [Angustibacter sp.]